MPQIYIKLAPPTRNAYELFQKVDQVVTQLIISQWSVPKDDIACSGEFLAYARNEADVQIEIRYTTGTGIYKPGKLFEPTIEMQSKLNDAVMQALAPSLANDEMFCSVWCKPHANSKFTICSSSN